MPCLSSSLQLIWILGSFQLMHLTLADDPLINLTNGNFADGPPLNNTVQEVQIRSLPGWQIAGTVQYIQAGGNITLPDAGRGVQLGKDGRVTQTFSAEPGSVYSLTFSLASAGDNCSTPDHLNVAVSSQSALFKLEEQYSDNWETYAWGFNASANQENVVFSNELSQEAVQQDPSITCGPVLDTVFLKKLTTTAHSTGNLLINGDFEEGPYALPYSSSGVLLEHIIDSRTSPLPGWTVGSTVKYIDSGHFSVPQGNAAIELVSGPGAGVHQSVGSRSGSKYILKFEMGDSKDECVGNMTVEVSAGTSVMNYTYDSMGQGNYEKYTMKFTAADEIINVSFVNIMRNQNENLSFCGPVIDSVVLSTSGCSPATLTGFFVWMLISTCTNFLLARSF